MLTFKGAMWDFGLFQICLNEKGVCEALVVLSHLGSSTVGRAASVCDIQLFLNQRCWCLVMKEKLTLA